jgi:acetamidase/formamidase
MTAAPHRIRREQALKFAFDWRDEPLLTVRPGEPVEIETWDAARGYFQSERDLAVPARRPGFDRQPPLVNPIAGPVFIEGVRRGDTLVVHIDSVLPADHSWSAVGPGRGPLGDSVRYREVSTEYVTRLFRHEPGPSGTLADGTLHFNDRVRWPLAPFIGTLGVAPDREVLTSADGQGDFGGNLDVRDFCAGNSVHLPVHHDGGLFYLGDCHASQGDTEFTGAAAECCATVRLRFEVLPGRRPPGVRIITPDLLITVESDRPLERAVETATIRLIDWLVADHGWTVPDAYLLVTTCPHFRIHIYQMCRLHRLAFVAGASLPRSLVSLS